VAPPGKVPGAHVCVVINFRSYEPKSRPRGKISAKEGGGKKICRSDAQKTRKTTLHKIPALCSSSSFNLNLI
jgi:hypothetical protein